MGFVRWGYSYNSSPTNSAPNRFVAAKDQEQSLKMLAELAQRATVHPLVRTTALKIIRDCPASRSPASPQQQLCELEAIYAAVRDGDRGVQPLVGGLKYVRDPRFADYFESPVDALNACLRGACGSDCDGHTGLVVALSGALGWKMGLRAYGPKTQGKQMHGVPNYSHVYAVAAFPKVAPFERVIGLDTTVPSARVGWEPPKGNVLTAWLE